MVQTVASPVVDVEDRRKVKWKKNKNIISENQLSARIFTITRTSFVLGKMISVKGIDISATPPRLQTESNRVLAACVHNADAFGHLYKINANSGSGIAVPTAAYSWMWKLIVNNWSPVASTRSILRDSATIVA